MYVYVYVYVYEYGISYETTVYTRAGTSRTNAAHGFVHPSGPSRLVGWLIDFIGFVSIACRQRHFLDIFRKTRKAETDY